MAFLTVRVDAAGFARRSLLDRLLGRMDDVARGGGLVAARLVRNWIRDLADRRHGTAERLGARPTKHFKASDVSAPEVRDGSATVTVTTPGIDRAFHDITILPVEAKALAIPLHADAYGIQPRELTDRGERLFRILRRGERKGGDTYRILFRKEEGGGLAAMYALADSARQSQDRSLLPSDEDLSGAFVEGAERAVKAILEGA